MKRTTRASRGKKDKPILRVKPRNYHPTRAELEEDLSIPDATPEKLAKAVAKYGPRNPNSG